MLEDARLKTEFRASLYSLLNLIAMLEDARPKAEFPEDKGRAGLVPGPLYF